MSDTRELEARLREMAVSIKVTAHNPSEQMFADVMNDVWAAPLIEAADALAAMRWIPVAGRLPKEAERVLIWFEWGPHGHRIEFGRRVNGHWRPEGANGNFDDSVNWWTPLPAAPKE